MKYLIDSNIIIYALNGNEKTKYFLKENFNNIETSFVTIIEVLSYPFSEVEEKFIRNYLRNFHCYYINEEIINKAIEFSKKKKIKLPDNIIASTAAINNLILVTANTKDFNNLDIEVLNPIK